MAFKTLNKVSILSDKMYLRRISLFIFISFLQIAHLSAQNATPATTTPLPVLGQLPSCSAAAKFYSKDSIVITCFGASTVHGVNGFDFETPLKQYFQNCYAGKVVDITNNGIPGQTSTVAKPRFEAAIAGRTGFLIILIGLNDAIALANKTMTIAETEANMRYFIKTALAHNLIPIVGTLQFANDENNDFYKTVNAYVKQINNAYKRIAANNKVYVADINKSIGRDFSLYIDALHPNQRGFEIVAYDWFDEINQAIQDKLLLIGLNQNYPNPTKTTTTIGFSLSEAGRVQIKLYSVTGEMIRSLYDGYQSSGYHEFSVAMSDNAPGLYIYVMTVGGQQISKKMIVIR